MANQKHLDAEWKKIQSKTFTRWCNHHLKVKLLKIDDLKDGFSDGVKLIVLLELLSKKRLGKYNEKPRLYIEKMENIQLALDFITKTERIKLVNIGSGDIGSGNLKLILGLIWTLILHYQISMGFGLDDQPHGGPTPRQALLDYINEKLTDKTVKNFTSNWNDGTVIANLVDGMAPGLCPEFTIMNPEVPLENATHAMNLADEWLGVPQVLAPEDMVSPRTNEITMMTYLSQFLKAKLKPRAPISTKKLKKGDPSKVKVYGPGIHPMGIDTCMPSTHFTINPSGGGDGVVSAMVSSPDGPIEVKLELRKNGSTKCVYVPAAQGDYKVEVKFNGVHVDESPYNIFIAKGLDPSLCVAYGPGVEGVNVKVESPTEFWVDPSEAGEGKVNVVVRGPKSALLNRDIKVVQEEDGKYHVFYMPLQAGPHTVEVTLADCPIKDSPFSLKVNENLADASKCRAEGPGLEKDKVEISGATWFNVHSKGAGSGDLMVNIKGPRGAIKVRHESKEKGLDHFTYRPTESGEHEVSIKYGGKDIPGSKFGIKVEPPCNPSKCSASGPGIVPHRVHANQPSRFTVQTKGAGHGDIKLKITGPSGEVPFQVESAPYAFNYTYQVLEPGEYVINIKFAGVDIPNAPFRVAIMDVDAADGPVFLANADGTFKVVYNPTKPGVQKMQFMCGDAPVPEMPLKLKIFDPSKVKAYGLGLKHDGVTVGDSRDFVIDTREAGKGVLDVVVEGPFWLGSAPAPLSPMASHTPTEQYSTNLFGQARAKGSVDVKPQISSNKDGTYVASCSPKKVGTYKVNISFADQAIPKSPYEINVSDPSLVKVTGPGFDAEGKKFDTIPIVSTSNNEPICWSVDCTGAGPGYLEAVLYGLDGKTRPLGVVEDDEDVLKVSFAPDKASRYRLVLKYAGNELHQSPIDVSISDSSQIKVTGPGLVGGKLGKEMVINLDKMAAGEGRLALLILGPSQTKLDCEDHKDGTATLKFTPETAGEYKLMVKFADEQVPGSVFIIPAIDPAQCKISGSGMTGISAHVGAPAEVIVDTRGSGPAPIDVKVEKPSGEVVVVELMPNKKTPGVFTGSYEPTEPGEYTVNAKFADETIDGSPFTVAISDPASVRIGEPGRQTAFVDLPNVTNFYSNGAHLGEVGLEILFVDGSAPPEVAEVKKVGDDNYQLSYTPRKLGDLEVSVSYGDTPIGDKVTVPVLDLSKVCIEGPGVESDLLAGKETEFVEATQARKLAVSQKEGDKGDYLGLQITSKDGAPVKAEVVAIAPQKRQMKYKLETASEFTVKVQYCNQKVLVSPVVVQVANPEAVKACGDVLENAVVLEEACFTKGPSKAGEGKLDLRIKGPEDCVINFMDASDGTYQVKYVAPTPDVNSTDLKFVDKDVPGSLFEVECHRPPPDAYKYNIQDLDTPDTFTVDCQKAGGGTGLLEVGASRAYVPEEFASVKHKGVFTFSVSYDTSMVGETVISCKRHGKHLMGSPFTIVI